MVTQLAPGQDAQLLQRGVRLSARRGARPEVEAAGVARCWREGGPFEDEFGGRAAARGGRGGGRIPGCRRRRGGGVQAGGVAE